MNGNDPTPIPGPSVRRRIRRLRAAGIIVLALGLAGAGLVWWRGMRLVEEVRLGDDKIAMRQVEVLYGRSGLLLADWQEDLKQPGTQALLIAAAAGVIAAGCFYVARCSEFDDEPG